MLAQHRFPLYRLTMQKVLIIVGPTASGKSALAVELAKKFDGEVISADSRQVYRGLDIATGKITKKEMYGVPHHLLDVASPKRTFTAADFIKHARAAIAEITARGKLPIICGGTGFYIDALVGRITLPEVAPNAALRKGLQDIPAHELFAHLKKIDPKRAKTIEKENPARLIRAIEIATELGAVPAQRKAGPFFEMLWIGIEWPKERLGQRIHARLIARMKHGMIAEAKRLHSSGLSYKRMRELGLEYRSLADFLQNRLTKENMLEQLETAIRRYALRQMRYWKRNGEIRWFPPSRHGMIEKEVERWLIGQSS